MTIELGFEGYENYYVSFKSDIEEGDRLCSFPDSAGDTVEVANREDLLRADYVIELEEKDSSWVIAGEMYLPQRDAYLLEAKQIDDKKTEIHQEWGELFGVGGSRPEAKLD